MSVNQTAIEERSLKIILGPHVSEKATVMAETNRQYVFKVATDATKTEIKNAVEKLFSVKVGSVQVLNVKGKQKRFSQRLGRRKNTKKAYVRLQEGHDINFMGKE